MSDYRTWDELTLVEQLQCSFSDFYKDVHGFRPRWPSTEQWNSETWLKEQLAELAIEGERVRAAEKAAEQEAVQRFEARVAVVIDTGAKDRATAIRWIFEAENDPYIIGDPDYFCYSHGLPYGYFKEVA